MAHKVGQDDALHDSNIGSEVSLSPECDEEDDQDVDRTRNSEMVVSGRPLVASAVNEGPSCSPPGATCLEDSQYRCSVEDTSSGGPQGEGHKGRKEVWRQGRRRAGDSSETDMVGGSASSFEAGQQQQQQGLGAAAAAAALRMEHADPNLYTSDEWEESDLSDTDDDHSDSSDDDDPKSQVDRLIEQVTLVYLDGENSNLSSEDDDSDYDDSDSESDITDVSPLISAAASPLGLSPVLPRRTLGTSPLALHDNRGLGLDYDDHQDTREDQGHQQQGYGLGLSMSHHYHLQEQEHQPVETDRHAFTSHHHHHDPSDMTMLLKAVVELDEKQRRGQGSKRSGRRESPSQAIAPRASPGDNHSPRRSPPIAIHPIDASPHHRHLRPSGARHHRRKNMSFPNEEVRRIDRDNQILLDKIMNVHSRTSTKHHHHHHHSHSNSSSSTSNPSYATHHHHHHHNSRPVHRPANSTVNRRREEEKIRKENMILLRKIQEAKPSREVAAFRSTRHHHHHHHRTPAGLSASGSCSASARTATGHVAATTARRKETAL